MLPRLSVLIVTLLFAVSGAFAQTESEEKSKAEKKARLELAVGDPAPPLKVGDWVKGSPIEKFKRGQVYVLDFWATWCGPCIRAMPHMTKTQKEYKDKGVTILGVSIWESKPGGVAAFVKEKGDDMGYTVATDRFPALPEDAAEGSREAGKWTHDKGAMSQSWMKAAGRDGIPSVFIVDQKGRIAWMGHPMGGMDDALDQIVKGTWDIEEAALAHRQEQESKKLTEKLQKLIRQKEYEKAASFARENLEKAWGKNAQMLNRIAWTIVDPEGDVEPKDLELAMKAAKRASKLTGDKDAAILDTLARVHFLQGHLTTALELQEKAVSLSPAAMKDALKKALDEYRKASKEEEL